MGSERRKQVLLGVLALLLLVVAARWYLQSEATPSSSRAARGASTTARRSADATAEAPDVHLKALGTPPEGRAAARAGRHRDLEHIYAGQLELAEAIAQSAQMLDLAAEKPSALLCMERDPAHCHRTLLLNVIAPDAEVVHLYA